MEEIEEVHEHTLYEWCLLNNIRPTGDGLDEDDFMLMKISLSDFKECIKVQKFKENSTPRKPEKYLELRMYGFVPYNISDIQKGIQFNHANDNYSVEYAEYEPYERFRREWKTNIILNGGTSNEGHLVRQGFKTEMYYGTMQQHLTDLTVNGVRVSSFYEPDLNSMLSAICFLVDERVFNKKLYPDFVSSPLPKEATVNEFNKWSADNDEQYNNWIEKIGGPKNLFLRTFLADKKLA